MEQKKGVLTDVIFHNKENGYTIAIIENEEEQEQFTAVGCLASADRGKTLILNGVWKTHPTYGEQFSFSSYEEEMPTGEEGIESFLASGVMKGIGKKTAAMIVRKFGDDTLRIIEEEPEKLTQISGIGPVKAEAISRAFAAHKEFAEITLFLQPFGISTSYAMKLYKVYGENTIKAVKENPYQLVDDVFGIGFKKADKIAENIGIEKNDPYRIKSGISYGLWVYINNGHTFAPLQQFCEEGGEMLDVSVEEVNDALAEMAFAGEVHIENLDGRPVVFLLPYYKAEQSVCMKLIELNQAELKPISSNVDQLISITENETGIVLSEQQKDAVKSSLQNGVSVITGGPGTGKTTIINSILKILDHSELSTAIAAPTGRAAKRITETTGHNASTIHRLLEYYYSEGEDVMRFGKNWENPLEYDAVIVDEASMIDILLMKGLLDAIPAGTRLIIVGDSDQLPSVGPGNVLRDIINSEIIQSVKLTEIFRQAQESLIVVNAHRINKGEYPDINGKDRDFFLLRRKTEKDMLETIKDLCSRRLPNFYADCDPVKDVYVLTPVRKGIIGSINLNKELQQIMNPSSEELAEKTFGDRIFREGDKVMQIKNNYQLEWKRNDDFTTGLGVFNGDVGFIEYIDLEFNQITVVFEDSKYVKYDFASLDELELAYAITVHKSQGSEFPITVMPVSWFPPMLATRNLLYTAVTRAKKAVVLVGSEGKMQAMIDNDRTVERHSGLCSRLKVFLEGQAPWDF